MSVMVFWPLALALLAPQDPPTLDSLEADMKAFSSESGFFADPKPARKINDAVLELVAKDKLKSGSDFRRAAKLYSVLNWDFEDAREKYELDLTAFALGDPDSVKTLPLEWDTLQISLGRRQRLGSMKMPEGLDSELFETDLAPQCVLGTLTEMDKALKDSKGQADNAVMQKTVDADQKDREGDWMKHTEAEFMAIMKKDKERLAFTKKAVEKGSLRTAQDFFNAALVMQHGQVARDFALAHELCLCSIGLGNKKDARWLSAASYDRMLRHCGQRQRFATQYDAEGLQKLDESGTNDTMRKALHCPTLDEAKKRVIK